mmetsp:Transcript_35512/g.39574  ORF Transcript_35512/g.39574 Transcript_35512/m.39574 type:complete len:158 (+) Transcript_35512:80-553(+)
MTDRKTNNSTPDNDNDMGDDDRTATVAAPPRSILSYFFSWLKHEQSKCPYKIERYYYYNNNRNRNKNRSASIIISSKDDALGSGLGSEKDKEGGNGGHRERNRRDNNNTITKQRKKKRKRRKKKKIILLILNNPWMCLIHEDGYKKTNTHLQTTPHS